MATTGPQHEPPHAPTDAHHHAPEAGQHGTPRDTSYDPPEQDQDGIEYDAAHETVYDNEYESAYEAREGTAESAGGREAAAPDDPVHRSLLSRWNALLLSAREGADGPDPEQYGRNLLGRWSEPQRSYHTGHHLLDVLNRIDELAPYAPAPGADPGAVLDLDAVLLAAWFHDAVYRPDRSENEERSARLAELALPEAGVPDARTAEAARLVRLTVTHDPEPGDTNGEVLCDADLAVLAGPPEAYAHYAAQIRQEYGFVPHDTFREGRAAVLRQLLEQPRLFRTPYAQDRWERIARRNLTTEMELLTA